MQRLLGLLRTHSSGDARELLRGYGGGHHPRRLRPQLERQHPDQHVKEHVRAPGPRAQRRLRRST